MAINVPLYLKRIENEIKALKAFQELSGGQLSNEAVSATWQGVIDKRNPIGVYSILAAFEATFIRTDGVNKPPLVDFGFLITPQVLDKINYLHGNVVKNGTNSVTYRISIDNLMWWPFGSDKTGTIKIDVSVYSPVPGLLSIERVYS